MTLHSLLPLIALLLNVLLVAVTLVRNPGSRLNRVFAYFVTGMAVWNMGSFMLRQAPNEATAAANVDAVSCALERDSFRLKHILSF